MFAPDSLRSFRFVLATVLLLPVLNAQAACVTGLYEAMVPVTDQNPSLRNMALREVLRAVVTGVSGRSDLPVYFYDNSLAVGHLVEQFGYESVEENGERRLFLWARLNPEGVQRIIRDQGLPVWPEERPATLIWLAVEDETGHRVIAEGSDHKVVTALGKIAEQRGLPIIMPLMDLSESVYIDFTLIANMEMGVLAGASERYASQYVLVGHLSSQDGLWQGRWQMAGEEQPTVVMPTDSLENALLVGVELLASGIAWQFSGFAPGDNPQYMEITIDDIQGAADYGRSLNYLRSLSLINQVDVVRIDQHGIHFRLHTRADIASVLRVIGIGRVLYARDTVDELIFGLNP